MRPNKSFGQNFLVDRSVLERMVETAEIEPGDQVLELGAGTGVLTRELAQRARRVVAVELERDMFTLLEKTTAEIGRASCRERCYLIPREGRLRYRGPCQTK